jgi:hypothetical protein
MGSACRTQGEEEEGKERILVENAEEKRPQGRFRREWDNNIKTDVREMGWRYSYISWMEPVILLLNSQEPSTCSYSEPDQYSPHHPILSLQDPS